MYKFFCNFIYFLIFYLNNYQIFAKKIRFLANQESEISKEIKIYIICIILTLIIIIILIYAIYKSIKINKKKNNNNTNLNEIDSKKKNFIIKNKFKAFIFCKDFLFKNCCICLQQFIENKCNIFMSPCGHLFHKYCLKKYFLTNIKNNTCPVCKFNFFNLIKDEKLNFNKVKIISFDESENPDNYTNLETEISLVKKKNKLKIIALNN